MGRAHSAVFERSDERFNSVFGTRRGRSARHISELGAEAIIWAPVRGLDETLTAAVRRIQRAASRDEAGLAAAVIILNAGGPGRTTGCVARDVSGRYPHAVTLLSCVVAQIVAERQSDLTIKAERLIDALGLDRMMSGPHAKGRARTLGLARKALGKAVMSQAWENMGTGTLNASALRTFAASESDVAVVDALTGQCHRRSIALTKELLGRAPKRVPTSREWRYLVTEILDNMFSPGLPRADWRKLVTLKLQTLGC